MADSREEFLVELYTGINVVLSDDFTHPDRLILPDAYL